MMYVTADKNNSGQHVVRENRKSCWKGDNNNIRRNPVNSKVYGTFPRGKLYETSPAALHVRHSTTAAECTTLARKPTCSTRQLVEVQWPNFFTEGLFAERQILESHLPMTIGRTSWPNLVTRIQMAEIICRIPV